ncbi:MAG: isochorismate synthase MenF [Propioniciclava sp.]
MTYGGGTTVGAPTARLTEPFTSSARRGVPLLWATGTGADRQALLGWGERFRVDATGPDRFAELSAALRRFAAGSGTDPRDLVAFVTVSFAADSAASSTLVVPDVLGRWSDGVLSVPAGSVLPMPSDPVDLEELDVRPGHLTREGYRRAVAAAVERITAGELEKVVLARDLIATGPDPMDVPAVLNRLHEANPRSWTFHVDGLIGASPEMLVATRGRQVRSQVLAGSANATGDPAVDDLTATRLAASAKDHVEHLYAARSITERLGMIADVASIDPVILRLPRIMHLATDVTGLLREDRSALDVAGALHPSAAVCGTPTEVAAQVLADLEGFDRGRYAGPVGWMDATGDGEFALALRCGQVSEDARSVRLFAGGGIVAGSDPSEELAETAQKFLPMYEALSPVARP